MSTAPVKSGTPKSALELAKKAGAKMVDIKFVDTFGTWQHFSVPVGELTEEVFAEGFGFDGSSIRGWKSIEASDMLAMPDARTAFIDPFCAVPTLSLTCTIAETGTKEAYNRDPRGIAQRGEGISRARGWPTARSLVRRRSSSSLTTCVSRPRATARFTRLTVRKASGTAGGRRCLTWVTNFATKRVIFRWRRRTRSKTFARRCAW